MQEAVVVGAAVLLGALAGWHVDRLITWSLEGRADLEGDGQGRVFDHLMVWGLVFGRTGVRRRETMMILAAVLFGAAACATGATLATVAICFYVSVGLALTYTDLRYYLLPDRIVLPAIAVGGALEIAAHPHAWAAVLLGSAGGFAVFYALAWLRPGALGGGDVKLMALIGAATGLIGMVQSVLLGAVAAGVIVLVLWRAHVIALRRDSYIPYGPYFIWAAYALILMNHLPRAALM